MSTTENYHHVDPTIERIDHVGWANGFITDALRPFDPNEPEDAGDVRETATPSENLAFAQVHATLAVVEAQRTANLIAYVQLLEMQYAEAAKHSDEFDHETRADSIVRHGIALDRIREGLGL
ncbi:hypothetical protein [Microbacterium algeriense]|uniref:hypothetical protein n=1 Tax=Microbacterium algeriense TaxID=2615184 RepID=UPI0022DFBD86|nr:hypothetical protein [Microbacterium algeriense]